MTINRLSPSRRETGYERARQAPRPDPRFFADAHKALGDDLSGAPAGTVPLAEAEHAAQKLAGALVQRGQRAEAARAKRQASAEARKVPDQVVAVNASPRRPRLKDLREAAQARRTAAQHREDPR
jgi:hypothetical protein